MHRRSLLSALLLFVVGCSADSVGRGLAPTPPGDGPRVRWDLEARPFPDIPFPNDVATRPDTTSPTGRRVNISVTASTDIERTLRERLDTLSGFSTFAPISVGFDAPLDVLNLVARHGRSLELADDAVFLLDLDADEAVPLDIGDGAFPVTVENRDRYYPHDPRLDGTNLLFESVDEDLDGDGQLDPGEDTDGDGVLDYANTLTEGGDPVDEMMTFYERETDTLILRPLIPLRPETTYAVVLTRRLVGLDGEPVRSPFPFINHAQQTPALRGIVDRLTELTGHLAVDDIAFAWSFTTQSVGRDLEDLRMGLYGEGPFAWLEDRFGVDPIVEVPFADADAEPSPIVLPVQRFLTGIRPAAELLIGEGPALETLEATFVEYIEYVILGRLEGPELLHPHGGIWRLDASTGEADVEPVEIPWVLTVPKVRAAATGAPPFPVALYAHGTGGFRLEGAAFASHLARFGIATLGMELYGHGLVLSDLQWEIIASFLRQTGLGPIATSLADSRTMDIDGDGAPDPAGDFWTVDAFRSRDAIRQSALDISVLVRMLRSFDGVRTWSLDVTGDGTVDLDGLAGDFDQDGRVDVGGPDTPYFVFGNSLGGIVSAVAAASEPAIVAAAPISGGGGLIDVAMRSRQPGVPEGVVLPLIGPLVLGDAATGLLSIYGNSAIEEVQMAVASLPPIAVGERIRVTNLRSGEIFDGRVRDDLTVRISVAADAGDPIAVANLADDGSARWRIDRFDRDATWNHVTFSAGEPLVLPVRGAGAPRQTPRLRRIAQVAQMAADAGDPVNYAPIWWQRPLYQRYGQARTTNVAIVVTAGDTNVPAATGVSMARAAGLVSWQRTDPRFGDTPHRLLVDNYVVEGIEGLQRFAGPPYDDPRKILFDADRLSENLDGYDAPTLPEPLRLRAATAAGTSVLRLLYVRPNGWHSIAPPDPSQTFDTFGYTIRAIGYYFASRGRSWVDDVCLASDTCDFLP